MFKLSIQCSSSSSYFNNPGDLSTTFLCKFFINNSQKLVQPPRNNPDHIDQAYMQLIIVPDFLTSSQLVSLDIFIIIIIIFDV